MGLGTSISNFFSKIFNKPKKVTMVGLNCAGKTSILYQLKCEIPHTVPTIGLNIKTGRYRNFELTAFDLGGATRIRSLLCHFYDFIDAVIFVFNSQDRDEERCRFAAEELHKISSEMVDDKPLLIFANMQDFEDAMNLEEINKILHPQDLKQKNSKIQLCSAKTGEGLHEGFEWINKILCPKN